MDLATHDDDDDKEGFFFSAPLFIFLALAATEVVVASIGGLRHDLCI